MLALKAYISKYYFPDPNDEPSGGSIFAPPSGILKQPLPPCLLGKGELAAEDEHSLGALVQLLPLGVSYRPKPLDSGGPLFRALLAPLVVPGVLAWTH